MSIEKSKNDMANECKNLYFIRQISVSNCGFCYILDFFSLISTEVNTGQSYLNG